jgi:O-antigen/teichoic acid export membrane protein
LLALVRGVIIPRYLGPGLYGILGALTLITKYGSYLQLGMTTAIGREVPYAAARGEGARAEELARLGYSFNLLTAVAPALLLVGYALLTWGRYMAVVSWGLLAIAVLLVTTRLETYFATLFRARRQFSASFWFSTLRAASLFAFAVGFLYLYGLYGVFVGLVLSGVLVTAVGTAWTRSWAGPWPDWSLVRKMLPIGLPLAGLGALGFLLQSADRLVVIRYFAPAEIGYYMLAVTAATLVYFLPMNIGQAMAPRIYGLRRDGDRLAFEEYLVKPSLVITYLVAVAGGFALLGLWPFIRYVLPAFLPSLPLVAALLVGITCQGGAQGAAHILIALGRFRALAAAQACSLAVALLAFAAAIYWEWGLVGMAAGASAGLVTFGCLVQFTAWRLMSLPTRTLPRAFGYLLLPPAAVAAGLVFAFFGGTFLIRTFWPEMGRPLGDVVNLGLRLLLFSPTVVAFGWYVERETGFWKRLRKLVKEGLSPPAA